MTLSQTFETETRNNASQIQCTAHELLSVIHGSPSLACVLLFNSFVRAFRRMEDIEDFNAPEPRVLLEKIVSAGALAAEDLGTPEVHIPRVLAQDQTRKELAQARHLYRRSYFAELCAHQEVYFAHFQAAGVSADVMQLLLNSCDQERLLQGLERLIDAKNSAF